MGESHTNANDQNMQKKMTQKDPQNDPNITLKILKPYCHFSPKSWEIVLKNGNTQYIKDWGEKGTIKSFWGIYNE